MNHPCIPSRTILRQKLEYSHDSLPPLVDSNNGGMPFIQFQQIAATDLLNCKDIIMNEPEPPPRRNGSMGLAEEVSPTRTTRANRAGGYIYEQEGCITRIESRELFK